MAWSYIAYTKAQNIASGGALDGDVTLNIQAGDVLVGVLKGYGSGGETFTVSDGGSNNFTMLHNSAISSLYSHYTYLLSASANSTATITVTPSSDCTYRSFMILQFRPTSGTTVTLNTYDITAQGNSETPTSNTVNIPDGETLVFGGYSKYGGGTARSISDAQIADLSADGTPLTTVYYLHGWYKVFSSAQNNATAKCTLSSSGYWHRAGILVFKAVSGGSTYQLVGNGASTINNNARVNGNFLITANSEINKNNQSNILRFLHGNCESEININNNAEIKKVLLSNAKSEINIDDSANIKRLLWGDVNCSISFDNNSRLNSISILNGLSSISINNYMQIGANTYQLSGLTETNLENNADIRRYLALLGDCSVTAEIDGQTHIIQGLQAGSYVSIACNSNLIQQLNLNGNSEITLNVYGTLSGQDLDIKKIIGTITITGKLTIIKELCNDKIIGTIEL